MICAIENESDNNLTVELDSAAPQGAEKETKVFSAIEIEELNQAAKDSGEILTDCRGFDTHKKTPRPGRLHPAPCSMAFLALQKR